jgi:peptidoglycan/xylan/chitin deacetylase (PgdA/CDA1 family)
MTAKPLASVSLDLDNLWSYLKVRGDEAWRAYPSYLDLVVPRILDLLARRGLRITVFVVGQDAALPKNRAALRAIAHAGHDIGNHSFHHEPWLHLYEPDEVRREIETAEEAILAATGIRPRGFRGPGFSSSRPVLETLLHRGYRYDASTFPTFIGPLARAFYFRRADLGGDQAVKRGALFGGLAEGLRPNRPYRWTLGLDTLLEIPVTVMPFTRLPMHLSYVIYLARSSRYAARLYTRTVFRLARACGLEPSLLLHPLDFIGKGEAEQLAFFPGMDMTAEEKLAIVGEVLDELGRLYTPVAMDDHAVALSRRHDLALIEPRFATAAPTTGSGHDQPVIMRAQR